MLFEGSSSQLHLLTWHVFNYWPGVCSLKAETGRNSDRGSQEERWTFSCLSNWSCVLEAFVLNLLLWLLLDESQLRGVLRGGARGAVAQTEKWLAPEVRWSWKFFVLFCFTTEPQTSPVVMLCLHHVGGKLRIERIPMFKTCLWDVNGNFIYELEMIIPTWLVRVRGGDLMWLAQQITLFEEVWWQWSRILFFHDECVDFLCFCDEQNVNEQETLS